jgi:hypothetical protein
VQIHLRYSCGEGWMPELGRLRLMTGYNTKLKYGNITIGEEPCDTPPPKSK